MPESRLPQRTLFSAASFCGRGAEIAMIGDTVGTQRREFLLLLFIRLFARFTGGVGGFFGLLRRVRESVRKMLYIKYISGQYMVNV